MTGVLRRFPIVGYFGVLSALAVWRVLLLVPREFDLGFLVSGLAAIARHGPTASVPWAGVGLLADHFSPALLPLAPVALLPQAGMVLVVVQAAAVAATVAVVWWTSTQVGDERRAAWMALAVAAHPAVLYAALWDAHANVMGLPFVAVFLAGLRLRRTSMVVAGGIVASLFREDLAVFVLLVVVLAGGGLSRRARVVTGAVGAGAAWTYAVTSAGRGLGQTSLFGYVDLADPAGTVAEAIRLFTEHGWIGAVLLVLVTPWVLMGKADWRILVPALLISLPIAFGASPVGRSLAFHYYAIVPVAWALALRPTPRSSLLDRAAVGIGALWLVLGPLGTSSLAIEYSGNSIRQLVAAQRADEGVSARLREAASCVRDAGVVAVDGRVTPFMGGVEDLYVLPQPFQRLTFETGLGPVEMATPDLGPPEALVTLSPSVPDGYRRDTGNTPVWWGHGGVGTCAETE